MSGAPTRQEEEMSMAANDDFTHLVIAEMDRAARDKEPYTLPWLDLDVDSFRAYREGARGCLPEPFSADPVDRLMMSGVHNLDVLCLAGGGGQQSAVFGLLGARVTVLDLMEAQLDGDRAAAAHYGYPLTAIQGDMRDLSPLPTASFERVYQPISTLYLPSLDPVYRAVARVLRPGGLYFADYTYPLLYMAQVMDWDGQAYGLRVGEPYQRGEIREDAAGRASFTSGQPIGEWHHLLSDIVNGLIGAGLAIRGVWENPRPDSLPEPGLEPGTPAHRDRYLPFGLSVVASKPICS